MYLHNDDSSRESYMYLCRLILRYDLVGKHQLFSSTSVVAKITKGTFLFRPDHRGQRVQYPSVQDQ